MTSIYRHDPPSASRHVPYHGLTGRDEGIITTALAYFIAMNLHRSGDAQAKSDAEDAIAILFAHCGCDLDYFALRFPELAGHPGPH